MLSYYKFVVNAELNANILDNFNLPSKVVNYYEEILNHKSRTWKQKVNQKDYLQWDQVSIVFMIKSIDEVRRIIKTINAHPRINEPGVLNVLFDVSNEPLLYVLEPYQFPVGSKVKTINDFIDSNELLIPKDSIGIVYEHTNEFNYKIFFSNINVNEDGKLIHIHNTCLHYYNEDIQNVVIIE